MSEVETSISLYSINAPYLRMHHNVTNIWMGNPKQRLRKKRKFAEWMQANRSKSPSSNITRNGRRRDRTHPHTFKHTLSLSHTHRGENLIKVVSYFSNQNFSSPFRMEYHLEELGRKTFWEAQNLPEHVHTHNIPIKYNFLSLSLCRTHTKSTCHCSCINFDCVHCLNVL